LARLVADIRALDLDDVGTEVSKGLNTEGGCQHSGEV
jgi:hypothetical protein